MSSSLQHLEFILVLLQAVELVLLYGQLGDRTNLNNLLYYRCHQCHHARLQSDKLK